MKKEKLYIKGLDGIRALAILGVTLFHIFPNSIKGGYLGVSLFFVLTGFLLAITSKRDFHLFSYIKKRIVRIYPALLIVIFTTIAILFFLSPNSISGMKQEVLSIVLGYNNIWQIHQNADYFSRISNASPFTHFWYLGIELQYYLIWPILFLIYKMGQKIHKEGLSLSILSILAFLSMILMPLLYREGMDVTSLYYGTHTRIYALLFGSILGFLWTGKKKKVSNSIKVLSLVGTVCILGITLCAYIFLDGQSSILYRGGMVGMTFLFVLLIYLVSHSSLPVGNIFEIAPLKWLGKHSYSIFLWQYPVLYVFTLLKLNDWYYKFVEILVIVLLAIFTDYIVNVKQARNKIVWSLVSVCTAASMCVGGYGLYLSDDSLQEAQKELKEKLEENAKEMEEKKKHISLNNLVMIGDSVLLSVSPYLYEMYPDCFIDAAVSRHCGEEVPILEELKGNNQLGDTVVISMGTNGVLYDAYVQVTLAVCEDRDIFWINNYCPYDEWQDSNNAYLEDLAKDHPNLHVVDWYSIASTHPEYLSMDGVHPNDEGCVAFANMIQQALER